MSLARVCHVSTVHNPRDGRIFRKECASLAKRGADVWFIGAQDGEEIVDGVHVVGIGKATNRVDRLTNRQVKVWKALDRVNPDLVHIHDPELIPLVLAWKTLRGRAGVFDAHEDLVGQIDSKAYLSERVRPLARAVAKTLVTLADKCFDGIIAVTPAVSKGFTHRNRQLVHNYPLLSSFYRPIDVDKVPDRVVYVGMLSGGRQTEKMFDLADHLGGKATLVIAGKPDPEVAHLFDELDKHPRVDYRGSIPVDEVPGLLASSVIGLVFLEPLPNYVNSLPTKLFEYMAAGIPFISTDLPFLVNMLEKWDCGVFVDTSGDAKAAAEAAKELLADPERCKRLGENGRRAIAEEFNFEADVDALVTVEERALKRQDSQIVEA
ncbi:glycosyltransferase [Cutibacterium avidum]|uniref:glycosyltransferase n=1 Tax=Cutibacterium avidum TaxID=33010 RepID=UPI001C33414C|nr:glycosyltransferase [Cutibacterium avidum]BCQ01708.1 glycosyl transferase [Cutibacterium avidum]